METAIIEFGEEDYPSKPCRPKSFWCSATDYQGSGVHVTAIQVHNDCHIPQLERKRNSRKYILGSSSRLLIEAWQPLSHHQCREAVNVDPLVLDKENHKTEFHIRKSARLTHKNLDLIRVASGNRRTVAVSEGFQTTFSAEIIKNIKGENWNDQNLKISTLQFCCRE